MLVVKTYVKPSSIPEAGLGLFAGEFIAKGSRVWVLSAGLDLVLSNDDMSKLDEVARGFFRHYAYYVDDDKQWVLCIDNARFINHSHDPNTIDSDDPSGEYCVASRDILPDEELTCDYTAFDDDYKFKLGL